MKSSLATTCAVTALAIAAVAAPASAAGRTQKVDPFGRPVKKSTVAAKEKPKETIIAPPAITVRQAECKSVAQAGQQVQSLPCMYLVRELKLQGVFNAQGQPEAFLFAEPTKQSLTVRAGDKLFDGRVVSIQEPGPSGSGQIVLEQVTRKQVGKKIEESKQLVTLALTSGTL